MLTPPPPPSIVRLYVSVVTVVAKFVREYSLGIAHSIRYDQRPHVDHVLGLCTHVFLAHELGELQLEQDLFATLTSCAARQTPWSGGPTRARPAPAGHPPATRRPCCQGSSRATGSSCLILKPLASKQGVLSPPGPRCQAVSLQLLPSWAPGPEAAFVPGQGRLSSSPAP